MQNSSLAIKGAKRKLIARAAVVAKVAAGTVAGAMLLTLAYLLAAPVVLGGRNLLKPRRLNLEEAKNYYAVIAAGVGSFAGASGVFLGAFYYFNRLGWETRRARRDRGRARLDELYKRIEDLDDVVSGMLFMSADQESTRPQAEKVVRALSSFEQLLNAAAEMAAMSDEHIAAVVQFYSYVERRCQWLLEPNRTPPEVAGASLQAIDVGEYLDRLYDARQAIHESGDALS